MNKTFSIILGLLDTGLKDESVLDWFIAGERFKLEILCLKIQFLVLNWSGSPMSEEITAAFVSLRATLERYSATIGTCRSVKAYFREEQPKIVETRDRVELLLECVRRIHNVYSAKKDIIFWAWSCWQTLPKGAGPLWQYPERHFEHRKLWEEYRYILELIRAVRFNFLPDSPEAEFVKERALSYVKATSSINNQAMNYLREKFQRETQWSGIDDGSLTLMPEAFYSTYSSNMIPFRKECLNFAEDCVNGLHQCYVLALPKSDISNLENLLAKSDVVSLLKNNGAAF